MDEKNEMQDLLDLLTEIGLPFAYDHFAEGESPDPPFITFLLPGSDNFSADGKVYLKVDVVHIELYTDEKNPETELLRKRSFSLRTRWMPTTFFMKRQKSGSRANGSMRSSIHSKGR